MQHKKKKITKHKLSSTPVKIFIGIIAIVLIIIVPLTVYYSNQQANLNSKAAASTTLAFSQSAMQTTAGSPVTATLSMNPGTNAVGLIQLVVEYDSSMVTPNASTGFQPNATAFPTVLDGPTYGTCNGTYCTMSIALSIGNDVTKAITQQTTVATLNFTAVKDGTTQVAIDPTTQVFSIASADQANENVLSSTTPITITVGAGSATTPTAFPGMSTTPGTGVSVTTGPTLASSATPSNTTTAPVTPTSTSGYPPFTCHRRWWGHNNRLQKLLEKIRKRLDDIDQNLNKMAAASESATFDQQTVDVAQSFDTDLGNVQTKLQNETQQLQIKSKDKGGCVGSFDPNNPDDISNCDQGTTQSGNVFQDMWNNLMKIFGGK